MTSPRLLTGDTPTGKLHLGHWVGSVENRVRLQSDYDCYFLLANTHAFTTQAENPDHIRQNTLDIVLDYLAMGIDPEKSTIFVESDIPAIFELATLFSMLIPYPRLMRNPTIKDEIRDKQLGNKYSMGFLWYPILQVTDILAMQASIVPVGEDQIPHIELTREVARRFHQMYSETPIFPVPKILLGKTKRLVGTGPPDSNGQLLKMSKSLHNAIFISDDSDTVQHKIMRLYTDPQRLKASDPGRVEDNPLWMFHDAFNPDESWVEQAKDRYRSGSIGDVECKKRLVDVINDFLHPMRERRNYYAQQTDILQTILKSGAEKANVVANETLQRVKDTLQQIF